jgi:ATP phosphoribosyltransferase
MGKEGVLIRSPVAPEPALQPLLDSIVERMAGVVSSQGAK